MLVRLICWLFSRKNLSARDRSVLTNTILNSLGALPLHATITVDEGKIFIRGVPLNGEKAIAIRTSARAALDNLALNAIHEQVLYEAVSIGLLQGQTLEQVNFAKAGIWFGQKERELLKMLAAEVPTELLG